MYFNELHTRFVITVARPSHWDMFRSTSDLSFLLFSGIPCPGVAGAQKLRKLSYVKYIPTTISRDTVHLSKS